MDSSPGERLHTSTRILPPSEGMENKVTISFATVIEDIHEDPVTGIQTLIESNPRRFSIFFSIEFSIASSCHNHICDLLIDRLVIDSAPRENLAMLREELALYIASTASDLGFGTNGFEINILLDFTEPRVSVGLSPLIEKLVSEGTIDAEELKMGKEPCCICLEDLSCGVGVPTRMPCSHVFHNRCLLEWFSSKTTCPMCRRCVLAHDENQQN